MSTINSAVVERLDNSILDRHIGPSSDAKEKKISRNCNCKRSNCLKLYCECFANGAYCTVGKCNCISCMNNNNDTRREAVEATLERNPHAFRSKIFISEKSGGDMSTKHHKGCHCKKSNCLKKYCECFQGNVVCSDRCRCIECRNYPNSSYRLEAIQKMQARSRQGDQDYTACSLEGFPSSPHNPIIDKTESLIGRNAESNSSDNFQDLLDDRESEAKKSRWADSLAPSMLEPPFISDAMIEEVYYNVDSRIRSSSVLMVPSKHGGSNSDIYDNKSVKRLKTDIVETLSECVRDSVTRSLASTLRTSSDDPQNPRSNDSQIPHSSDSTPLLHLHAMPLMMPFQTRLEDNVVEDSMQLPSSSHLHHQTGSRLSPGRIKRELSGENSVLPPSFSEASGHHQSRPNLGVLSHVSSGSAHSFPLLGAQSLTLEPTVSIQQQMEAKTHWLKQQTKLSDDDNAS